MKNAKQKIIWLCDLTHTYQTVSMNKMPLGIGMIASYCKKEIGADISISIFKFLDELTEATKNGGKPFVVGFANYVWNQNLNIEVARRVKKLYPETAVIFGGPNFPANRESRQIFFKNAPWVDFYIPLEGEQAFCELTKVLKANDGDIAKIKTLNPKNTVFMCNERLIETEILPRIDLTDIPSPYLDGFFDKYFGRLVPMVQTVRGCPFTCAYCYDGTPYWCRIMRRGPVLERELDYIAANNKNSDYLYVTDANFGMYQEDMETCRIIARLQDKYSWPKLILVNTGKNNTETILEATRITKGALTVSAALQSTDPVVLKNINRKNLPIGDIIKLAEETKKFNSNTELNSDIILGLPGDTAPAHYQSLKDVVDSDVNTVTSFQFMRLPGTALASREAAEKYGLQFKYRVLPRCCGRYTWLPDEDDIITTEVEAICVTNNTMSFDDYLDCRQLDLTMAVFYNGSVLTDLYRVMAGLGFSVFDFIVNIREKAMKSGMRKIYEEFTRETEKELFESPEEILALIKQPGVPEKYRSGEYGANLIFKYKVLSFTEYAGEMLDAAYDRANELIGQKNMTDDSHAQITNFLTELKKFHSCLITDILNTDKSFKLKTKFNLYEFHTSLLPLGGIKNKTETICFGHTPEQKAAISKGFDRHDRSLVGLSQMFSQMPLNKILRKPILVE